MQRDEKELVGLVYSLTQRPKEGHRAWYQRPAVLGVMLLISLILNIIFW